MKTLDGLVYPVVHLNGSGRAGLLKQYESVFVKLNEALELMAYNGPHMRDYYVDKDPDAFTVAQRQHRARMDKIQAALDEIQQLYDAVEAQ